MVMAATQRVSLDSSSSRPGTLKRRLASQFRVGSRYGRGLILGVLVLFVVSGYTAVTAAPILSFDSVQVTADGINPTPVQIEVKVFNPDPTFNVTALDSQLSWTTSGGASVGDLAVIEDSGTVSGSGYLFDGLSPLLDSQGSNTPPVNWGVSVASGSAPMANGTTYTVATLNLEVAAGVRSGVFDVSFLTGNQFFNVFTDDSFNSVPYANGNNGSSAGLVTVVPEAGTGVILGISSLSLVSFRLAQRVRRRRVHQEPLI